MARVNHLVRPRQSLALQFLQEKHHLPNTAVVASLLQGEGACLVRPGPAVCDLTRLLAARGSSFQQLIEHLVRGRLCSRHWRYSCQPSRQYPLSSGLYVLVTVQALSSRSLTLGHNQHLGFCFLCSELVTLTPWSKRILRLSLRGIMQRKGNMWLFPHVFNVSSEDSTIRNWVPHDNFLSSPVLLIKEQVLPAYFVSIKLQQYIEKDKPQMWRKGRDAQSVCMIWAGCVEQREELGLWEPRPCEGSLRSEDRRKGFKNGKKWLWCIVNWVSFHTFSNGVILE